MSGNVTELRPGLAAALTAPGSPARVQITPLRRLDIEEARKFLAELDARLGDDPSPARLAYVIGRLDGHARTLLDVIDAITEVR